MLIKKSKEKEKKRRKEGKKEGSEGEWRVEVTSKQEHPDF